MSIFYKHMIESLDLLIDCLIKPACSYLMILAISSLHGDTTMMLGAAMATTTICLRQGSPTIVVFYLHYVVQSFSSYPKLKAMCRTDCVLDFIHCLLFNNNDTVILATSRAMCLGN